MLYQYGSAASGLEFTINAITDATGTHFTVNVLTGSLNLNALYWGDGDAVGGESFKTWLYWREIREQLEHERRQRRME